MYKIIVFIAMVLFGSGQLIAQEISGRVIGEGKGLAGANVRLKEAGKSSTTNGEGRFVIASPSVKDSLIISYVGFHSRKVFMNSASSDLGDIILERDEKALMEVMVSTGYYQVPKERATGSFEFIDNATLNRSTGVNILERLEGIANGVQFDRSAIKGESRVDRGRVSTPEIRVRGLSTIEAGSSPLIVVDNFPFEGEIESINPNDVENITILKDAAAASIWGARAGNGVIVITTKRGGKDGMAKVSYQGNRRLTQKPNLFYNQGWLPSATVMEIQKSQFTKGVYPEVEDVRIPAYVELLISKRDDKISKEDFEAIEARMQNTDFRNDVLQHLYGIGVDNQHSLNISGGNKGHSYYISGGYDDQKGVIKGYDDKRLTLGVRNDFVPFAGMEIQSGIWLSDAKEWKNGLVHSNIGHVSNGEPYARLVDEQGEPVTMGIRAIRQAYSEQASIQNPALLDWSYNPLKDRDLMDNTARSKSLRLSLGLKQDIGYGLDVNVNYQYQQGGTTDRVYYDKDSYYVRDRVNRFTSKTTGQRVIPYGGILDLLNPTNFNSHSFRSQLNYSKSFKWSGQLSAIAGFEIRKGANNMLPASRVYNHSNDILGGTVTLNYLQNYPTMIGSGSSRIPTPVVTSTMIMNRDLSYYGNMSYVHLGRYVLSSSLRWDGSNLFGVKANQKGTPLWSVGGSWQLSEEGFYGLSEFLPYLRLRATYGSAGNVDKTQSAYPTISMGNNPDNNLLSALLTHPGNPALRWERVNTVNLGVDWRSAGNRVSGSIEYYNKKGNDLLGAMLMDPTTGLTDNYKMNYADMTTKGLDLQLQVHILKGAFGWVNSILFSNVDNKVRNYRGPKESSISNYFIGRVPVEGRALDALYSLPWDGLSSVDGLPIIYEEGIEVRDYQRYFERFKVEDLVNSGVSVAPNFSSMRNVLSWNNIQLDFMISARWGHSFRISSISSGEELYFPVRNLHMDYFKRWTQAGDERSTNVPAETKKFDQYLDDTYKNSEILIEKGDVLRLNDVNLSYTLPVGLLSFLPKNRVKIYGYARNLGIIWQASKKGVDPDYPNAEYPAQRTYAFGLQVDF